MKLVKTEGCTAFSLTVDGIEEIDLSNSKRIEVIDKLCDYLKKNPQYLNYILQDTLAYAGEYKEITTEPCECCGDTIDSYTLEI